MWAEVWMFSTFTTPARFTAAVPLKPKLIPKAPMLSLLLAVTATPWKPESTPSSMARGPSALASPDGVRPDGTMLCDLPAFEPGSVSVISAPPSDGFFVQSWNELPLTFST